jgi:pilus assembly protein CpaB
MKIPKLNRSWVVLLAALIFGGLAAFSVSKYINQTVQAEKARLKPNEEMVEVIVAKADMKRGAVISNATVSVRPVPKAYVTGMAITPNQFNTVEGSRTLTDLRGGEMVLRGGLDGADATTFATKVLPGQRAMTINVDDVNAIAGLVQPGDRIDLYYSARGLEAAVRPGELRQDGTNLFLQNVLVLATGKQIRAQAIESLAQAQTSMRSFGTVTIAVSPDDARRLIAAQKAGALSAVLRNPEDKILAQIYSPSAAVTPRPLVASGPVIKLAPSNSPSEQTEFYIGGRGGAIARQAIPVGITGGVAGGIPSLDRTNDNSAAQKSEAPSASQMEVLKSFFESLRNGFDSQNAPNSPNMPQVPKQ